MSRRCQNGVESISIRCQIDVKMNVLHEKVFSAGIAEENLHLPLNKKHKRQRSTPTKIQFDYTSLREEMIRRDLVHSFKMHQRKMSPPRNIDEELLDINSSIRTAINDHLPTKPRIAKKPWISNTTLELIERRNQFRQQNDSTNDREISKQIKKQVRLDRQNWLNELLDNGNWRAVKDFKQAIKKRRLQTNLKN